MYNRCGRVTVLGEWFRLDLVLGREAACLLQAHLYWQAHYSSSTSRSRSLYDVVLAQSSLSLLAAAGIASLLPAPVRVSFADLLFRLIGFHRVHGCFLLHDHDALYCGEALGTDWRRIGMQPIGQRHFRITAGCKTYPGRKTQQTSIPRQSPSAGLQASNE